MSKSKFTILEIPSNFIRIRFSSEGQSIFVISNIVFFIRFLGFSALLTTFDNMKRLGFRAAFLSTEKKKLEREPYPRKPLNPNCFILCVGGSFFFISLISQTFDYRVYLSQ